MGKRIQDKEPVLENVAEEVVDDQVISESETEEVVESEPIEEVAERETVEDSVREAIKELKSEAPDGAQDKEAENPVGESSGPEPKGQKTEEKNVELDDEYEPPARLDKKEKTLFSKLPKEFKPAVARLFKDHEAQFTRTQRELQANSQEARHVLEAVRPYYTSKPELAKSGISEGHLVTALIGSHQKLTSDKMEDRAAELATIAQSVGLEIEIKGYGENGSNGHVDIENHPKIKGLQEQLEYANNWIRQQSLNTQVDPILAEFKEIQAQKDDGGNLLYPELQKHSFIQYVKPLVSELTRNDLSLSHGEALKQAVIRTRQELGYSPQPHQTKLLGGNNNNSRAVSAAVSVRGRVAQRGSNQAISSDIPRNESMEESVRRAVEDLKRGVN